MRGEERNRRGEDEKRRGEERRGEKRTECLRCSGESDDIKMSRCSKKKEIQISEQTFSFIQMLTNSFQLDI